MNKFISHPLTVAIIPMFIIGAVGYFGFVQSSENTDILLQAKLYELQKDINPIQQDIKTLQVQLHNYSSIPPRVSQLEASQKEMRDQIQTVLINQGIQSNELSNIKNGINDIKDLLNK